MSTPVITGQVVHGDKRGRQLGFPTANVRVPADAVPAFGVYAGLLDGAPAAVSVGVRPTFGDGLEPLLEAHLLDFDGDLYGRQVAVELLGFVRAERSFPVVDELVEQMRDDVRAVRALVAQHRREVALRVTAASEALREGRMVVVEDDAAGSGGAWMVVAAEHADASAVNRMATAARGLVELALTPERCRRLGLDVQSGGGQRASGRALTCSIEARRGVTTGISAADRAVTIAAATAPQATDDDVVVPGHVFPLRTAEGGVLERAGYAETAVDLVRIAALAPAAVACAMLGEDGELADAAAVAEHARVHGLRVVAVSDVVGYRRAIADDDERSGPIDLGCFRVVAVPDRDGRCHVAHLCGDVAGRADVGLRLVGGPDGGAPGALAEALSAVALEGPSVVLQLADGAWDDGEAPAPLLAALLRGLAVRGVRSVGIDRPRFSAADVGRAIDLG